MVPGDDPLQGEVERVVKGKWCTCKLRSSIDHDIISKAERFVLIRQNSKQTAFPEEVPRVHPGLNGDDQILGSARGKTARAEMRRQCFARRLPWSRSMIAQAVRRYGPGRRLYRTEKKAVEVGVEMGNVRWTLQKSAARMSESGVVNEGMSE